MSKSVNVTAKHTHDGVLVREDNVNLTSGDHVAFDHNGSSYMFKVNDVKDCSQDSIQLTKREQFAMAAMQGILSSGESITYEGIYTDAVKIADGILKELEK